MKSRVAHEYHEGPDATNRFTASVKTILSVPRSEMKRREKEYQKQQALKPKRGPKRKAKPSASRDRGSDD